MSQNIESLVHNPIMSLYKLPMAYLIENLNKVNRSLVEEDAQLTEMDIQEMIETNIEIIHFLTRMPAGYAKYLQNIGRPDLKEQFIKDAMAVE